MASKHYLAISILLIIIDMASPTLGSTTSPYSVDFDLHNMAGFDDNTISSDDIFAFIQEKYPNSPMLSEADIGSCFISAGQTNNVNPAFLVATACLEGGFGTLGWAQSHPECHNPFGYGIPSGATQPDDYNCMDGWCAMVQRVASVIAHGTNYYAQGLNTVSQVRAKYAASPNAESIAGLMNELYAFSVNLNEDSPSPQETGLPMATTQEPKMLNISYTEAVAFSHDGSKLAISAQTQSTSIWDVASGTKLQTLNDGSYSGGLRSFAFSPDDSKLAIGIIGQNAQISIWDVNSGEKLQWMDGPSYLTAFSTDGSKLITCDFYNTISIWDVARGTKLQTLNTESAYLKALSLDGSKMATCNDVDRTTRIWDVASGTKLQEIKHNHPANFVAFNFDGSKLATSSDAENKIEIWDVNSEEKLQEISFNKDADRPLGPLAFSPDGSKLATYHSATSTASIFPVLSIRIWDVNSGEMLQELNSGASCATAGPWAVAFSPDGSKLATGVAIWDIATSASKKSVAEELPASVVAPVTGQNTTASEDASESSQKSPGIGGILAIAALLSIFALWKKD